MRGKIALTILLVASFAMAPTAAADTTESGSVSTGEIDTYAPGGPACPQVITTWTVTLTLEDPAPTDVVSLSVEGSPGAGVDVATGQTTTAQVSFTQNNGCQPAAQVAGLVVDGSVDYTLTFDAH
jgi:hypothetical protein